MQKLDYVQIGKRIRHARKEKGWSQEILAKKCDISLSFAGHIERGTRYMSLDTFACMCEVLELPANELLWGVANPYDKDLKAVLAQTKKNNDNYSMYVKIMKSVAQIMEES